MKAFSQKTRKQEPKQNSLASGYALAEEKGKDLVGGLSEELEEFL
ncbi:MAG: hypothetical protein ACI4BD_01195 [Paludibacteraceae bacterium]